MKKIQTKRFKEKQATDTFTHPPVSGVPGNIFKSKKHLSPDEIKKIDKKKKRRNYIN